jgi:hypothetical protein
VLLGDVSAYGTAIIAAVSAVVGGALSAGANLLAEARRSGRETQREADRAQRELRQATRLVLAELTEISAAITQSAKSHMTWRNERQLPAFAWREYRATLAATVAPGTWRWVEMAYNEGNALNWQMIERNAEFESDEPVHFADNEWLREPFRTIRYAMQELEVALGDPKGIYGYTGYRSVEEMEEGIWKPRADGAFVEPTE